MSSFTDLPSFSDGRGMESWPRPVVPPDKPLPANLGELGVFRLVLPDDGLYDLWLTKLASATAMNMPLSRLPDGYHLFLHLKKGRQDAYLFGHPSGRKYRSPNEFLPHLAWLFKDKTHDYANCECWACGGGARSRRPQKRKLDGQEEVGTSGRPFAAKSRKSQQHPGVIVLDDDAPPSQSTKHTGSARIIEISDEEDGSPPSGRDRQRPASKAPSEKRPKSAGSATGGTADIPSSEPADGTSPAFQTPTFWEGKIRYKSATVEAIALRLETGKDNSIISPKETYWAPCPLFASFPLEFRMENGVTTEVAEQMMQTAQRYISMSMRQSPILWAYHVLVLPSFNPEGSTKEENIRMFERLRDTMNAGRRYS